MYRKPKLIQSVFEQGSGVMNEDQILITQTGWLSEPETFGVFDGATSLTGYRRSDGHTGAFLASAIVRDMFQKEPPQLSLRQIALFANRELDYQMSISGIDASLKVSRWSTTAAVVRTTKDGRLEWLQISDSLIMVLRKDGTHEFLGTKDFDHDVETLFTLKAQGREAADLADREVAEQANVTYGFLNGEPQAEKFLHHGFISLDGVASVLLFTDGLFLPKEDPREPEDWKGFLEVLEMGGLIGIQSAVRDDQKNDPGCMRYPRFKVHDDIAAIALDF